MKDPYLYPGTAVLINKKEIRDKVILDEYENRISTLSLIDILTSNLSVTSVYDILKLHGLLFHDVYMWAGSIRTIGLRKQEPILNGMSVIYASPKDIKAKLDSLELDWSQLRWDALDAKILKHR